MTSNKDRLNALREHVPAALKVARNMVGEQDAHDVVQDAVLAICGRAEREGIDEEVNWLPLLLTYTRWAGLDWLKKRKEIDEYENSISDLPWVTEPDNGDSSNTPEDPYGSIASQQLRTTPAWPTAIEHTTPEHLVTAAELRDLIREIAIAKHGARDYAIFCSVVMDGLSQEQVARTHDLSQSMVSRVVLQVRSTLAEELAALGYDVA